VVAAVVAARVVDELEGVDLGEDDAERVAVARAADALGLEQLAHAPPVGQPRERVRHGERLHFALDLERREPEVDADDAQGDEGDGDVAVVEDPQHARRDGRRHDVDRRRAQQEVGQRDDDRAHDRGARREPVVEHEERHDGDEVVVEAALPPEQVTREHGVAQDLDEHEERGGLRVAALVGEARRDPERDAEDVEGREERQPQRREHGDEERVRCDPHVGDVADDRDHARRGRRARRTGGRGIAAAARPSWPPHATHAAQRITRGACCGSETGRARRG
jgi:hypothetical protein